MRHRLTLCGLAALSFSLPALAQSLAACKTIASAEERLACYDRLAEPPAPVPAKAADNTAEADLCRSRPPIDDSLLASAWELDRGRGCYLQIRPYKPVYVLPFFHSSHPNTQPNSPAPGHQGAQSDLDGNEAKFQISLKTRLAEDIFGNNGDLWFGYTQSSRWQVYNERVSRPFRETNYEPELMLLWRTDFSLAGWRGRFVSLGFNHQSNGRSLPLSRSWNRIIAGLALERPDWTLTIRPWWRVPEAAGQDDNPDIANYLGRGEIQLVHRMERHQFSALIRHSLRGGDNSRGAVQLDYAFPIAGSLRGHLQWFSGYGESMIDYNHRANYYGVGLSLVEWY